MNRRRRREASGQKRPSPTFDPVAKGQPGVGGAESVSQHPLLVADDWLQHGLVLDLSGGDNDAAVHEVCDGVGHVLFALAQEGLQTEHLSEHQHRTINTPGSLVWRDFTVWSLSLSHPVGHQSTHRTAAFAVVHVALAGAHQNKDEADGDGNLQGRFHHHGISQPDKSHHWFLQELQDT